jgi:hypothetical protein
MASVRANVDNLPSSRGAGKEVRERAMSQTDSAVTQTREPSPLAHAACIFFRRSAAWARARVAFPRLAGLLPNSFRAPVRGPSATPAGVDCPCRSVPVAARPRRLPRANFRHAFSVLVVRPCSRDAIQTGVGQQALATFFRRSAAWVIPPRRCYFRAGRELVSLLVLL